MKYLIVIDMQNDFIDGALGTAEAVAVLPSVVEKVRGFDGHVVFTRDTHTVDYMNTQEGKNLPVAHCVEGTDGWQLAPVLESFRKENACPVFDKPTFGSAALAEALKANEGNVDSVELCGVCTDICVISNALLIKAFLPEVPVNVDASCCAGTSPAAHSNALAAMKMCQISVKGE